MLGNDHLTWKGGGGGLWFFSKKIFWFPMLLKKIFWFWWRKKKIIWFRVFTYNLMLNSVKKLSRFARQKKNSNSCVVRKTNSARNKKPYPPPFQVKWPVPYPFSIFKLFNKLQNRKLNIEQQRKPIKTRSELGKELLLHKWNLAFYSSTRKGQELKSRNGTYLLSSVTQTFRNS